MASISASSSRRSSDRVEELFDRPRVWHTRVAVTNGCGMEFNKAAAGAFILDADIAGDASSPARASARNGMISSSAI